MTVNELKQGFLERIGEGAAANEDGFFGNDIYWIINSAIRKVCLDTKCYRKTHSIVLSNGVKQYLLTNVAIIPETPIAVYDVFYNDEPLSLFPTFMITRGEVIEADTRAVGYENNFITFNFGTLSADTCSIYGAFTPRKYTTLDDALEIGFNREEEAIIHYALYLGYMKYKDMSMATNILQVYKQDLVKEIRREVDTYAGPNTQFSGSAYSSIKYGRRK